MGTFWLLCTATRLVALLNSTAEEEAAGKLQRDTGCQWVSECLTVNTAFISDKQKVLNLQQRADFKVLCVCCSHNWLWMPNTVLLRNKTCKLLAKCTLTTLVLDPKLNYCHDICLMIIKRLETKAGTDDDHTLCFSRPDEASSNSRTWVCWFIIEMFPHWTTV